MSGPTQALMDFAPPARPTIEERMTTLKANADRRDFGEARRPAPNATQVKV